MQVRNTAAPRSLDINYIQSMDCSVLLLSQTRQLLTAEVSLTDPIELMRMMMLMMMQDCNFRLLSAYLNDLR